MFSLETFTENFHSVHEENVIKSTSIQPTPIHNDYSNHMNVTSSDDVSQTPNNQILYPKDNNNLNHSDCNNEVYSKHINVCFKCNNVCNNIDSTHNINDILNTETVQCASPSHTSHTSEGNVNGNLNLLSIDTATIVPNNPCIAILCGACAQQVTTNNTSYENRQRNKSIHSHEQVENISQDIVVTGGETQSRGNRADSLRTALSIDVVDVIPTLDINQLNQINDQDDVKLNNLKNLCHFLHRRGQNNQQFVEQGVQVPSPPTKCNESIPINCYKLSNDTSSNPQLNDLCSANKSSCELDHIDPISISVNNNCAKDDNFIENLTGHSDECNNLVSVEESLCEETAENRLGALHCDENNKKKDISEQCHISGLLVNNDTKHEHRQCSPNCENFEASNRLRRLENRFKDLAFTKKLLQREDPSVSQNWSENSTLHCSVTDEHHSTSDTVRCASSQLLIDPPTSTIISNYDHSCCRSSIKEVEWKLGRNEQQSKYTSHRQTNGNGNGIDTFSSCDKCGGKIQQQLKAHTTYDNNLDGARLYHQKESFSVSPTKGQILSVDESNFKSNLSTCKKDFFNENKNEESELNGNAVGGQINSNTPESTADSEEISNLFFEQGINKSQIDDDKSENNVTSATNSLKTILQGGDLHTNCEFDVRHLQNYSKYSTQLGRVFECYDELDFDSNDDDEYSSSSCDCSVEPIVPAVLSYCSTMRETIGPLRGLLKNPNRAAPVRKNRVVFDETRNQFFDADYIILIREDCQYDEEDEEPCTCGEHELVRLCCEENCQCTGYSDENRTPQVGFS